MSRDAARRYLHDRVEGMEGVLSAARLVETRHAGCDVAALAFATTRGDWTIPAQGSLAVSLSGALALAADAPDACWNERVNDIVATRAR